MEIYGSASWSKKPTTCPYSGPNNYSPWVLILFFKIHFSVILPYMPSVPVVSFFIFPHKTLHAFSLSPIVSTCPSHLYHLELTTVMLFIHYIPVIYLLYKVKN